MKFLKPLLRLFIWIVIIIIVFIGGVSVCLNFIGKDYLEAKLSEALNRSVRVGHFIYYFPREVSAYDVYVNDILEIKEAHAQIGLDRNMLKEFSIDRLILVDPRMEYKLSLNEMMTVEQHIEEILLSSGGDEASATNESESFQLNIDTLKIVNGLLEYRQELASQQLNFKFKEIEMILSPIRFPAESLNTNCQFGAILEKKDSLLSGSRIDGKGSMNWYQRDLDAEFHLIDEAGQEGLLAKAVAIDNDLNVEGRVFIKNKLKSEIGRSSLDAPSVIQLLVGTVSDVSEAIDVNFSFDTKLDDFKITEIDFSGKVKSKEKVTVANSVAE